QAEVENDLTADYAIITPTYKIMTQATLPKFMALRVIPGTWRQDMMEWRTGYGGRIFFRSAEDPSTLESMTLKSVWLDEAGRMKAQVWPAMISRTFFHKGRILMTTSPYTNNWVKWQVRKKFDNGDPDFDVAEFETLDNPWYQLTGTIEDERKKLRDLSGSQAEYERRFLGKFSSNEGLVYPEFSRDIHLVAPLDLPLSCKRFAGIDFGYTVSHPTIAVFFVVDNEGKVYVEDVYKKTKGLMSDHAEGIKKLMKTKDMTIWGDAAAAQEIAELQNFHLPVIASSRKLERNSGIGKVARFIRQGKFFVMDKPDNHAIVDEFETYSWQGDEYTLTAQDKVVKKDDDGMDAIRYGIINALLMAPEPEAMPILRPKPVPILDVVTGYPTGAFGQGEDNGSFRYNFLRNHGMLMPRRAN
ncbi:MAG: terminase large subunit, partial [Proteobacteria bacterium]|nr:terminase large subunit [Pseudomonadota bacterium]